MGLLDKLWDDVVAGPQPDHGLGSLRRVQRPGFLHQEESAAVADEPSRLLLDMRRRSLELQRSQQEAQRAVSQSLAIPKPPPLQIPASSDNPSSSPSTPAPASPFLCSLGFSRGGGADQDATGAAPSPLLSPASRYPSVPRISGLRKTKSEKLEYRATPSSPTVYDWVVLSALDR